MCTCLSTVNRAACRSAGACVLASAFEIVIAGMLKALSAMGFTHTRTHTHSVSFTHIHIFTSNFVKTFIIHNHYPAPSPNSLNHVLILNQFHKVERTSKNVHTSKNKDILVMQCSKYNKTHTDATELIICLGCCQ